MFNIRGKDWYVALAVCLMAFSGWSSALAQLRIVTYNTTQQIGVPHGTVLSAVGVESVNGIAKPIDILAVQEQADTSTTTAKIVDLMNEIYGEGTYARGQLDGATRGAGRPGLVYNTGTVDLVDEVTIGTVGADSNARQTVRYQLRPVGYDESADFYIYNSHLKAGNDSVDRARRAAEAKTNRANADVLGIAHVIYLGDFNTKSSSEPAYQTLIGDGPGQAFDPIGRDGDWNNSDVFKDTHTQASTADGGSGGGMDDRFDFQLISGELLDDEGLDYIQNSYRAFGNNGTHDLDGDISSGTGASPQVLAAIEAAADHLPVVADYQLPAIMTVTVQPLPEVVRVTRPIDLTFTVENSAPVLVPQGADELDYKASIGGLEFSVVGTDEALGGGKEHRLTLDTSVPGPVSHLLEVLSSSPQVASGSFAKEVTYNVALPGDANVDFAFDQRDIVAILAAGKYRQDVEASWREGDWTGDGRFDQLDIIDALAGGAYLAGPYAAVSVVPEPSTVVMFYTLLLITLGSCHRKVCRKCDVFI